MKSLTLGCAVIVLSLVSLPAIAEIRPFVIYGSDSRLDLFEVTDAHTLDLADSTVALIKTSNIRTSGNMTTLSSASYSERFGLCEGERFYDQKVAAYCSGSLVGDDLVLTAGHCVLSQSDCQDTRLVFGFGIKHPGAAYDNVATSEVYGCAKLIKRKQNSDGADYALIRLDRKVTNHSPLQIKRESSVVGAGITVIGHPSGLPTKVATGFIQSTSNSKYIVTNLDTYGSNSGSAVFDSKTGEIEGILARGAVPDFRYEKNLDCYVSDTRDENAGIEDVIRISVVAPLIDAQRNTDRR